MFSFVTAPVHLIFKISFSRRKDLILLMTLIKEYQIYKGQLNLKKVQANTKRKYQTDTLKSTMVIITLLIT